MMSRRVVNNLSKEKNAFSLRVESGSAKVSVKADGSFTLSTSLADGASYFSEGDRGGEINQKYLKRLFKKLSRDNLLDQKHIDDFESVVIQLEDAAGNAGKYYIKLESDPIIRGSQVILKGNINDTGKIVERRRNSIGKGYKHLSSGDYRNVALTLSSFDKREAVGHWKAKNAKYGKKNDVDASVSMRLFDDQGVELSPQYSVVEALKTYDLIDKSYEFGDGASANFVFSVTPNFSASISTPHPKWWQAYQYLDPSRYKAKLGANLTWDAIAYLDPGVGKQGDITLAQQEFKGPSFGFGQFPVTGELGSGMDFSVTAHVDALDPANLTLEATQSVGFQLNASSKKTRVNTSNSGVQWPSMPTVDDLTGLSVSVDAGPYVMFELGLGARIPHFGSVDFIKGGPKISVPMDIVFQGDVLDPGQSSITADLSVDLSGSVTALPFLKGGFKHSLGTVSVFEETIPILG